MSNAVIPKENQTAWQRWELASLGPAAARIPAAGTQAKSAAKLPTAEELRQRLELAREQWPKLTARLKEQLLPPAELRRLMAALDAAATPAEIGVTAEQLRADLLAARMIRRRYTMLDLAAEAGLLEACIDEVVRAVSEPSGGAAAVTVAAPVPGR